MLLFSPISGGKLLDQKKREVFWLELVKFLFVETSVYCLGWGKSMSELYKLWVKNNFVQSTKNTSSVCKIKYYKR